MAQRIVTTCDVHAARDEDAPGLTWSVAMGPPGGKVTTYEIDLCPDDGKGLADLLDMVAELGRKVDGPGRPRKAPAAQQAAAGSAGGQAAAAKAREGGPYPCPDCDREFATPQGRGAHRSRAHGYRTDSSGSAE